MSGSGEGHTRAVLTIVFWLAVGMGVAVVLASAPDVWLSRTDPAGRGLASSFALLVLPFPCVAVLLFLLSRCTALRVGATVLALVPLLAVAGVSLLGRGARVREKPETASSLFPDAGAAAIETGNVEKVRGLGAQGVSADAPGRNGRRCCASRSCADIGKRPSRSCGPGPIRTEALKTSPPRSPSWQGGPTSSTCSRRC